MKIISYSLKLFMETKLKNVKFLRISGIFGDLFTLKVNIKWSMAFKANKFCPCKLNYNQ